MFQINLTTVIQMLVDHELDRSIDKIEFKKGIIKKPGIAIEFFVETNNYNMNKCIRKSFYMIFTGDTSVFYASQKNKEGHYYHSPFKVPVKDWINTSNHDSCWRSDGFNFINDNYFKMCEEVNPDIAPKDVSTYNGFKLGHGWPVRQIFVEYKNTENYRNEIVKIYPKE